MKILEEKKNSYPPAIAKKAKLGALAADFRDVLKEFLDIWQIR